MCVFVYTLPQLCRHPQFQNVCECAVARGAPEAETGSQTLGEPKFLFDTSRSSTATPAHYRTRFPCKKRRALRPVPAMCAGCLEGQAVGVGTVTGGGGGGGSGPPAGLLPVSGSTSSGMTNGSGASTPRSFWKLTNPVEMV